MIRQYTSSLGAILALNLGGKAGFRIGSALIGPLVVPPNLVGVAALPVLGFLISSFIVVNHLMNKYQDEPLKAISSVFLFELSYAILLHCTTVVLIGAFVSTTLNPFTLPILLAMGASVLCALSILWLTQNDSPQEEPRPVYTGLRFWDPGAPADTPRFPGEGHPFRGDYGQSSEVLSP